MKIVLMDYHELQFKLKQQQQQQQQENQEHHNTTNMASLGRGASRVSL